MNYCENSINFLDVKKYPKVNQETLYAPAYLQNQLTFTSTYMLYHATSQSLKKKNFMAPFYGWGSTASRLESLRGGNLLFTTMFSEIPGTDFIDLGRMKS